MNDVEQAIQRPPAEVRYAAELEALKERDAKNGAPVPQGWALSARSVVDFVLGDNDCASPKFVGARALVERCVVSLATNRGLMLIGEPGTAKSMLSELLAAAVSGDTTLTIQGSAATTEDAIKYSWNYALLLAEGPTPRALVPAPVYRGMKHGKVVRFEEITRCAAEIQDAMLSVLSDRVLSIPELDGDERTLYAARGFNVIATANTRDRGVNDMSAALKRRFNFETIGPIASEKLETALVKRETDSILSSLGIPARLDNDVTALLVRVFRDLRDTGTASSVDRLSTAMSTAEAVGSGVAAAVESSWFGNGTPGGKELASAIIGSSLKDAPEDISRLCGYTRKRAEKTSDPLWTELDVTLHTLLKPKKKST